MTEGMLVVEKVYGRYSLDICHIYCYNTSRVAK